MHASTTSGPRRANGSTGIQTTEAPAISAVAERARRGEPDDRADRLLRRPEQAEPGAVVGQSCAHRGRDQAGVDAVDTYAVTQFAGLRRGDPGEPVDAGLGGRVHPDAGE